MNRTFTCSLRWFNCGGSHRYRRLNAQVHPRTGEGEETERARSPAPFFVKQGRVRSAGTGDDVAAGATLVVVDAGRLRVLDAVPGAGGVHLDGDVLDAGVVGKLQLGQVGHDVVGLRVIGRVGLDARDRGADVGLGGRLVRARPEAQVRGNRDGKEDSQNDDDNEKLDQRKAFLPAGKTVAQ